MHRNDRRHSVPFFSRCKDVTRLGWVTPHVVHHDCHGKRIACQSRLNQGYCDTLLTELLIDIWKFLWDFREYEHFVKYLHETYGIFSVVALVQTEPQLQCVITSIAVNVSVNCAGLRSVQHTFNHLQRGNDTQI